MDPLEPLAAAAVASGASPNSVVADDGEVIELLDDDDDDHDGNKKPAAAVAPPPPPAAVLVVPPLAHPLSEEDQEKRRLERLARKSLRYDPSSANNKKQRTAVRAATLVTGRGSWAQPVELDVDPNVAKKPPATTKDPWENYRRIMGPLRFDVVEHAFSSRHYYLKERPSPPIGLDLNLLYKEYTSYRETLPVERGSSVFVRVVEDRLDLVRFLITGPEDTPYQSGCFVFDMLVGGAYPANPPKVQFLTTGNGRVRFNPNLVRKTRCAMSSGETSVHRTMYARISNSNEPLSSLLIVRQRQGLFEFVGHVDRSWLDSRQVYAIASPGLHSRTHFGQ